MSAASQPPIVFGTDGWRARIGEDYTYENVRRCAQGVAEWAMGVGTSAKGVVIAYDRRFASEFFAQAAAEVLLAKFDRIRQPTGTRPACERADGTGRCGVAPTLPPSTRRR